MWQGRFQAFPFQDDDHLAAVGAVGFVATTLRGVASVVAPAKGYHTRLWQTRDRIVDTSHGGKRNDFAAPSNCFNADRAEYSLQAGRSVFRQDERDEEDGQQGQRSLFPYNSDSFDEKIDAP